MWVQKSYDRKKLIFQYKYDTKKLKIHKTIGWVFINNLKKMYEKEWAKLSHPMSVNVQY